MRLIFPPSSSASEITRAEIATTDTAIPTLASKGGTGVIKQGHQVMIPNGATITDDNFETKVFPPKSILTALIDSPGNDFNNWQLTTEDDLSTDKPLLKAEVGKSYPVGDLIYYGQEVYEVKTTNAFTDPIDFDNFALAPLSDDWVVFVTSADNGDTLQYGFRYHIVTSNDINLNLPIPDRGRSLEVEMVGNNNISRTITFNGPTAATTFASFGNDPTQTGSYVITGADEDNITFIARAGDSFIILKGKETDWQKVSSSQDLNVFTVDSRVIFVGNTDIAKRPTPLPMVPSDVPATIQADPTWELISQEMEQGVFIRHSLRLAGTSYTWNRSTLDGGANWSDWSSGNSETPLELLATYFDTANADYGTKGNVSAQIIDERTTERLKVVSYATDALALADVANILPVQLVKTNTGLYQLDAAGTGLDEVTKFINEITGQMISPFSATYAGLATVDADSNPVSNGDVTILTADDIGTGTALAPQYPKGIYITDGTTWSFAQALQDGILEISDSTISSGHTDYSKKGIASVEQLDQWGKSRRVRRVFNVSSSFDFTALGYADKTAVYVRNADAKNGLAIIYGSGGTTSREVTQSDGVPQTVAGQDTFNLQPGEIAFMEKDGGTVYVSVIPGKRTFYFNSYALAAASNNITFDGLVVIRDKGEIWGRTTNQNAAAFPANGVPNDDWFRQGSSDPQTLILNYIEVGIRSSGTNSSSNISITFVDNDGDDYPSGDFAVSLNLVQYTGGSATIITDKTLYTGSIGVGRNKQGTGKFYHTGDFPNGLSAIRVDSALATVTQAVTVTYQGTNYNDAFANIGEIVEPLYWTTSGNDKATDQAAHIVELTEYPEGTIISFREPDNTDPDYNKIFNWQVLAGQTISDTEVTDTSIEAELIAIKPKLERFGIGTVTPEGLVPDWKPNTAYPAGERFVAPMPINADFISANSAVANVNYIFQATVDIPNTIVAFDDTQADSGNYALVGVYKVNGTDDRVIDSTGTFVLDPLSTLSNSNTSEFIHWTVVNNPLTVRLLPAPGFITIWKDYSGNSIVQPTAANEDFVIPADVQMWVHRVGNAISVTFESNEGGGVLAKNVLTYPVGNFTAIPVSDNASGNDGAVYKIPNIDSLTITLPNKTEMDAANGIYRVRISGEWEGLSAQPTLLSFIDDTANGVEFGSGLPDSGNEWIDIVFDAANDKWIATSGGDVTLTQIIPTYAVHTEVPTTVRLYLIDGTGASAEGLYRKETVGNAPNHIG